VALPQLPASSGRRPRRRLSRRTASWLIALVVCLTALVVSPAAASAAPAFASLGTSAGPAALVQGISVPQSISPDPAGGGRVSLPSIPADRAGADDTQDRNATARRWLVLEELLVTALLVLVAVLLGRRSRLGQPSHPHGPRDGHRPR
jgi:hypothetical protein